MMQKPMAMRDVFLRRIHSAMSSDSSIFFVSADFGSPVLDDIYRDFPSRVVNVGIAEQNLINISAGLGLEGFKVYAYAIAPFITMRCYEQIKVNLSLLSGLRPMNINLIGVGAGFSYVVSGPTHHSIEDIAIMRTLPNFEIISPSDWVSAESSFEYSLTAQHPKYFRFDSQPLPCIYKSDYAFPTSGFSVLRHGDDAVIIATGYMVRQALVIADRLLKTGLAITVIDLMKLKKADPSLLLEKLKGKKVVFTMEEGFIGKGGMDSYILNLINKARIDTKIVTMGISDEYKFALGTRDELLSNYGLSEDAIISRIQEELL